MLRPPYTRYDRLFVYYFDRLALPPGAVRILHRGSREMRRIWLLHNSAGEQ
jgi:hypothetical protein